MIFGSLPSQRETVNVQIQDVIPQVDEAPEIPHTDVVNPPAEISPVVGPLWRSSRKRRKPVRYDEFLLTASIDVLFLENNEPATYKQAIGDFDSKNYLESMKPEMVSMSENQVLDLIDLHDGVKPLNANGSSRSK